MMKTTRPIATLGMLGMGMAITITAAAAPLPGGTLDPTTIPKYVQPLVIPPVMNNTGTAHDYDIAVRQFQQQILPGAHWNAVSPACQLPRVARWGTSNSATLPSRPPSATFSAVK